MGNNTAEKGSSDSQMSGVALARKALEDSLRLRKARLAAEAVARLAERERNQIESPEVEAEAND